MRREHGERRQQIAEAALKVLAEEGPRQLTARNLGERVGMDGSSLFRHFADMSEILHAALDDFEAVLDASIPTEPPSWSSLRVFFVRRLALVQARPEILRLAFHQHLLVAAGQEAHAARVHAVVQRSVTFLRACLEDAQATGVVPRDVPAAALVWVVMGMLRGAALGAEPTPPDPALVWRWLAFTLQQRGEIP